MLKKCLVVATLCVATILSGCNKQTINLVKVDLNEGNFAGNISNYGYSAIDGEWIYYINSEDGRTIYKSRLDGSEATRLNGVSSEYLNVSNGYVYFQNQLENNTIFKMGIDGSEPIQLNTHQSININLYGNFIYYTDCDDNYNVHKINLDTNADLRLNDAWSEYVTLSNGTIYYANGNDNYTLYSMNLNGDLIKKLSNVSIRDFNVMGNNVYYIDANDSFIYKLNLEKNTTEVVIETPCEDLNVNGGFIHYTKMGGGIHKFNMETKKDVIITQDGEGQYPNLAGSWLIYENGADGSINIIK